MERCPVCRARLKERQVCHRCGTDLTLAIAMEKKAEVFFKQALVCLQNSDVVAAKIAAQSSVQLHNKPLYLQFSGFVESLIDNNGFRYSNFKGQVKPLGTDEAQQ